MKVQLKHHISGQIKTVKVGFSWTTLFFGGFVALCRGDLKNFFIMWLLSVCTFGIAWLVLPFKYNKMYIKKLLSNGWMPANDSDKAILNSKGIHVA